MIARLGVGLALGILALLAMTEEGRAAGPLDNPGFAKVITCSACHGEKGAGDPARLIPGLAGQAPGYLAQQMLLFKQDTREPGDQLLAAKRAVMRAVPDSQFADLAAYYASLR